MEKLGPSGLLSETGDGSAKRWKIAGINEGWAWAALYLSI